MLKNYFDSLVESLGRGGWEQFYFEMQISWQAQHFANLEVQISWQRARDFVNFEVQISWQAQYFVNLEVQLSHFALSDAHSLTLTLTVTHTHTRSTSLTHSHSLTL